MINDVVILTPKFRSDCTVLALIFLDLKKKVGGASDLSRGGFRPPPPLADNPAGFTNPMPKLALGFFTHVCFRPNYYAFRQMYMDKTC